MKKLPEGFNTWIQFYDYISQEKPELMHAKKIYFLMRTADNMTFNYSISFATIERNCWREICNDRLTLDEIHQLRLMYEEHNEVLRNKIQKFLKKTAKLSKL
jgi:hypothetical protein